MLPKAILFDALGTLVELEPPWPRLIDALRGQHDVEVPWDDAKRAMIAEITYYKEHHDEGRDDDSLAGLRRRCAAVLRDELPQVASLTDEQLVKALLGSLRFAPYPDVPQTLAELRVAGVKLAVVSNWDRSLGETLGQIGLSGLLDTIVVSAEVGSRKPAPIIFETALDRLGVAAGDALFVGDSPETDIAGAIAAGIRPLLLDRRGSSTDRDPMERIFGLSELPDLLAGRSG